MVSELQTLYTESQDGMTKLARTVREKILTDEPVKEDELIDQLEETATEIGDLLSSPFGPRGMNKIIVNPVRDIFVTSDGKVILKEMDVLHPIVTTFKKLAKATGTTLMAQQDEIHPEDLGKADSIRVEKKNGENFVYITVRERGIVSILIREPVKYRLDKVEEAIDDALNNVAFLMKNKEIVNGRGAIEFELAHILRLFASIQSGKKQLAVQAYAEALENIPSTLARNMGMNSIDAMTQMRNAYARGIEARIGAAGKITEKGSEVYDSAAVKNLQL